MNESNDGVQGNSVDTSPPATMAPPPASVEPKKAVRRTRIKWHRVKREAKEFARMHGSVTVKSLCQQFGFSQPNGNRLANYLVARGVVAKSSRGVYSYVEKPAKKKARVKAEAQTAKSQSKASSKNWQPHVEAVIALASGGNLPSVKELESQFELDRFAALSLRGAAKKKLSGRSMPSKVGAKAEAKDHLETLQDALDTFGSKGPLGGALSAAIKEIVQSRKKKRELAEAFSDLAKFCSA